MNQNIWGPHLWFSLHSITFNYSLNPTAEERIYMNNFFISLKDVIPCHICKLNYKRHLKEMPINNHLNNRKDLVYWLIDFHNVVNSETGRRPYSYKEVIEIYEKRYDKNILLNNSKNNSKNTLYTGHIKFKTNKKLIYILISLLLIIILILFIIIISNNQYF